MRNLCVYYALMASFYNASIGALAKLMSAEMSSFEIVFWRNFFGLWLTLYALKKAGALKDFKAGEEAGRYRILSRNRSLGFGRLHRQACG